MVSLLSSNYCRQQILIVALVIRILLLTYVVIQTNSLHLTVVFQYAIIVQVLNQNFMISHRQNQLMLEIGHLRRERVVTQMHLFR